jgi:hypothetical protein
VNFSGRDNIVITNTNRTNNMMSSCLKAYILLCYKK